MIDPAVLNFFRRGEDVCYSRYSSPIGDMYILGNDAAVKALIFKDSCQGRKAIGSHFRQAEPDTIAKTKIFLDEYFCNPGRRNNRTPVRLTAKYSENNQVLQVAFKAIELTLDLSPFTFKEIGVYRELIKVPAGATISYGLLAHRSGIPGGARFVGNAMAKNNFPIIIPCHRVIKSDGSMGNYSGGVHIKEYLLDHEKSFC
jgi:O-6-methylguanine DNA methyltransferase